MHTIYIYANCVCPKWKAKKIRLVVLPVVSLKDRSGGNYCSLFKLDFLDMLSNGTILALMSLLMTPNSVRH